MLAPAWFHREELQNEYRKIIYNPEYKFLVERIWDFEIELDSSDENRLQMVSITPDGEILGFLSADIDRLKNSITSLEAIAFKLKSVHFSVDLNTFILDLFRKHHFRKITFEAIVGSPADKIYQRHAKRYNCHQAGILKEEAHLSDGKYYDVRIYEMFPK